MLRACNRGVSLGNGHPFIHVLVRANRIAAAGREIIVKG
jgi:hypothetical protein